MFYVIKQVNFKLIFLKNLNKKTKILKIITKKKKYYIQTIKSIFI